jgi:hypothetical protein
MRIESGMKPGATIDAHGVEYRFIEHPLYAEAHPGEAAEPGERCVDCAIAARPDGSRVLLWRSNGVHWSISRADPSYRREAA